ncbi:MAG: sterol desaturase family protein [Rhodospirillaceae bacterium]|jgi:sterol desaturase/sphingolipid hydroxylase (fatty acid hydroxylase superfamily)|nr:sterol desaturase family protein [Rhodospirillaceae bacterium]
MDDLKFGTRDKRGNWKPSGALQVAPLFDFPPRLGAILRWLPGYFLPWNLLFAASAVLYWHVIIPAPETMQTLSWGWILRLLAVNGVAVFLFYGALELWLYRRKSQANRFKYNARFPAEHRSPAFHFQRQNVDNIIRTFTSGVPIWTAYEVLVLHLYAIGAVPWMTFAENPVYLGVLALVLPIYHETHFYLIHRLIHWPPLYRWVHSVHHNSVNPSPWSSLSMHPVEHLLYFATALMHIVIPSNPILAIYQLHFAGFGAVVGHIGFDRIELGKERAFATHAYTHYLHHKYFEVNYGDALVPFDKWFGTWHDGTAEGEARMQARYERRKAKANAAAQKA